MKYRKDKTTNKKFLGSLVGNGVTAVASSLGADEQTAKMIGSGVGAVTGFASGDIVGGVAESGRFIGGATMNDDNLSQYGELLEGGSSIASSFIQPKAMKLGGDKKPPIYTNNPNDPRLQAYNDSLNVYNESQKLNKEIILGKFKNDIHEEPWFVENEEFKSSKDLVEQNYSLGNDDPRVKMFDSLNNFKTKPVGINIYPEAVAEPVYKKPEQPVKYRNSEIVAKQQQLIDAGFDIGSADSIWGKKSQAAWEELQNKQNTKTEEATIEKDEVLKEEIKNKSSLNEGEYRVPTNFPNVQIIRNKEKPLFYENANGDRVPFSNKFDGNFNTDFQYNKQMFAGGSLPNISADINPMNGIQQFKNMRLLANGGSVKPESMGKEMNALNSLTEYNEGGLHEQNPDGGVVLGNQDASVEEGEVQWNDFIFSNRINADEQVLTEYSLNKSYAGLTFADIAKKIQNKYKLRDNDPFTTEAENRELQRLADAHEAFKQVNMPEQSQEQPEMDMEQMNPEMMQSMETPMGMENMQPEMGMEQAAQPQQFAYGGKKNYALGGPENDEFLAPRVQKALNNSSTSNDLDYGMQGSDYVKAGLAGANTIARLANNKRVNQVDEDRYAIKGLNASRINVDPALSEANLAFNSLDETINQNATNASQVIAGRGNSAIKRGKATSGIRTQEDNRRVQKQDELNALMAQSAVQSRQMADNINMGNEITYRQNMDTIIGDAAQTGIGITEQASNRSMMEFLASKGYYNQNYLPGAKKTNKQD